MNGGKGYVLIESKINKNHFSNNFAFIKVTLIKWTIHELSFYGIIFFPHILVVQLIINTCM